MKRRITLVTLGVDDLERAVAFYRDGLGWRTEGIVGREFENGAVAFFDLENGLRLALWPRKSIAADTGLARSAASPTDFTLAHNVASRDEVDAALSRAKTAGARIVKPAHETFYGGYAGYFRDTDDHVWEIAFNPAWTGDAAIALDHTIVSARDKRAAAKRLAELLGVPWAPSGPGPFSPVFVSDSLTLDFIDDDSGFPVQHFCFRVTDKTFDEILARIQAAGIPYRSSVRGPDDRRINTDYGGRMVYWNEPDGHQWEMLTVSYARRP